MKTSIIVGGSRGNGLAISNKLISRGDTVCILSRNNYYSQVDHIPFDLLGKNFHENCMKIVQEMAPIDNLVFCQKNRSDIGDYDYEFDLNVRAVYNFVEIAKNHFSRNGSIVVLGSPAGQFVVDEQPLAYHASKAALEHLVRYYAVKLGPAGVRANCILPGTVIKKENQEFYNSNIGLKELFKKIIPLARQGTSEDIANLVNFLCSDDSSFITGQSIHVDGGLSIVGQESLARSIAGV